MIIEYLVVLMQGDFKVNKRVNSLLSFFEEAVIECFNVVHGLLLHDLRIECLHQVLRGLRQVLWLHLLLLHLLLLHLLLLHLLLLLVWVLLWRRHVRVHALDISLLEALRRPGAWLLNLLLAPLLLADLLLAAPSLCLGNLRHRLLRDRWPLLHHHHQLLHHCKQIRVLIIPLLIVRECDRVLIANITNLSDHFDWKLEVEVNLWGRHREVGRQNKLDWVLHARARHRNRTLNDQVVVCRFSGKFWLKK